MKTCPIDRKVQTNQIRLIISSIAQWVVSPIKTNLSQLSPSQHVPKTSHERLQSLPQFAACCLCKLVAPITPHDTAQHFSLITPHLTHRRQPDIFPHNQPAVPDKIASPPQTLQSKLCKIHETSSQSNRAASNNSIRSSILHLSPLLPLLHLPVIAGA